MRRPGLALLGVLAFALLILAVPAGRRPFWSSDEARFALLARDVLDHGRWLVPELRGHPYVNKPQLYFWSVALASAPAGAVSEVTAVIPSLVSAVATVGGVVAIGRLLWGWPAGLLAGLILATTPHFFVLGHQVIPDVMMTAWLVWALYFLLVAWRSDGRGAAILGFWVSIGGALLSKGPAGLVGLASAAVAAAALGGVRGLGRLRVLPGMVVLAVMAVPWLVPYFAAPRADYVGDVLLGHYPAWYFRGGIAARLGTVEGVLTGFLPWTLVVIAGAFWWRRDPDEGRRLIGVWTLTLWVLLALSGTQRVRYMLPVYPGLALLAAEVLARAPAMGGRRHVRVAAWGIAVLGLLAAAFFASPLTARVSGEDRAFVPDAVWERALIVALLAAVAVAAALAARRGAFASGGVAIALLIGALLVLEGAKYPGRYARRFDVRELAAAAASRTSAQTPVLGHPDLRLSYDFYLRRRVIEVGAAEGVVRRLADSPDVILITSRRRWEGLAPEAPPAWRVLAGRTVDGREMVVVGGDGQ